MYLRRSGAPGVEVEREETDTEMQCFPRNFMAVDEIPPLLVNGY